MAVSEKESESFASASATALSKYKRWRRTTLLYSILVFAIPSLDENAISAPLSKGTKQSLIIKRGCSVAVSAEEVHLTEVKKPEKKSQ
jgi:hypothetical protein